MNKDFIVKMVKAKQLEYEALKSLLPEGMQSDVDSIEDKMMDSLKDLAVEFVKEDMAASKGKETSETKKTKKVDIDFD